MKVFHKFKMNVLLLLVLSSCSLSQQKSSAEKPDLNFETLSLFEPGKTTQQQLKERLGKPDLTVELTKGEVTWIYFRETKPLTRVSAIFNSENKLLQVISWFTEPGEEESDLEIAKARFPSANFHFKEDEWVGHAAPTTSSYYDNKLGVDIGYGTNYREVYSISRYAPSLQADPVLNTVYFQRK